MTPLLQKITFQKVSYDVLNNSILHTHRSNDSPQQYNHCFRPAMKPSSSTNNENIQRFSKYRIMQCHVLWQKYCVTDINLFISIRPEVRHVNRKSTTLLSTTFSKTTFTVGTDSLSHTVRNLVILAYFDPTPKWKGGSVKGRKNVKTSHHFILWIDMPGFRIVPFFLVHKFRFSG